jgi:hypothetical protein
MESNNNTQISVDIPNYSGPLEVLLDLAKNQKVDLADISMKALKHDLVTNAKKSLSAGCNLVLYCAGNIKDNFKLIKSVPYIDKFTIKKTSEIYKILR